jgi:hypothetical protein
MMRHIYEKADRVDIWLGVVPRGDIRIALSITAQALANLEAEYLSAGVNWKGIETDTWKRSKCLIHGLYLQQRMWNVLGRFYGWCTYFKRIWIVQEVVYSKSATIFANDFEMDWDAIGTAAVWLVKKGYEVFTPSLRTVASLWELTKTSRLDRTTRKPLADLLLDTVQSSSTDRRDRIFALIGLSNEESDPQVQTLVNYDENDDGKSFRSMTRYLLGKLQTLEPLSLASNQIAFPGICSWAPEWREQPFRFNAAYQRSGRNKVYTASGDTLHTPIQIADPKLLGVQGFIFDTIVFAGERGMVKDTIEGSYFREIKAMLGVYESAYDRTDLEKVVLLTFTAGVNEKLQRRETDEAYLVAGRAFMAFWTGMQGPMKYKVDSYWRAAACDRRRFVITERGYLGLAPDQARKGDVVAVLYGGELPMILRPLDQIGEFQLVGESYVHGIMGGEALNIMQNERRQSELITLR